MWKFSVQEGERTALISCIVMWLCTLCAYTHTIQVWGYCIVYSCTGHSTTFFDVNESQLHTFFIYNNRTFGVGGQNFTPMKEQKFQNYLTPLIEVQSVVAERGYFGSMLEDPVEQPKQDW